MWVKPFDFAQDYKSLKFGSKYKYFMVYKCITEFNFPIRALNKISMFVIIFIVQLKWHGHVYNVSSIRYKLCHILLNFSYPGIAIMRQKNEGDFTTK